MVDTPPTEPPTAPPTTLPTAGDVAAAAQALAADLPPTPTLPSETLSRITGAEVILKFENHRFTASFKERGALNRLLALSPEQRSRGVIAMSAGNHAQGVARHAQRLGIPATIVMPRTTPFVKVEHTEALGAHVELVGDGLAEAAAHAEARTRAEGLTFIHPYDDPLVIAGQGTVALEILDAAPELDALIVPVGGGGLIGGMALALKARRPDIRLIGVQSALYPAMVELFHGRDPGPGLPPGPAAATIAEGIAVKAPGHLTRQLVRDLVDDMVTVSEDRIEQALALLLTVEKTVVEGAGAAPLAALLDAPQRFAGQRVGLVLSGGNIDTRLLAGVLMRDLVRQGRLARLRLDLADMAGELGRVTALIGAHGGNIVEVSHQRVFSHAPAKVTGLEVVVETRDRPQLTALLTALEEAGYTPRLIDTAV
ncbi:threonine ammonia-lyase [Roseospirillum parvum]|uniref:Threonine dehydratase n=1 Tax=Roseospirillum parvum TaxID=83401 RepID=A0A1G7UTE2_9PROT|nr:threonine ammonia-lyase [Roseospirillum parvum]SDG50793.1 threonine dehydratase [Roseospirillum parvum]